MSTNNTRQAAWVAIGTFFSMAVGLVTPMLLSRFFSMGDYGTYRQVMYVYATLLSVFTLGLPKAYAYFLPKHPDSESKAIISKITWLFFILGGLFAIVLFAGAEAIANILCNPDLAVALRVFSPVPLFMLPTMGLDGIFATYRKTEILTVYTVTTKMITVAFTVIPVIAFHGSYIHAIIGFDIASVFACIIALVLRSLPVREFPREHTDLNYKKILAFAIPLFTASIWGMLYESLNQFFISRYFGKETFAVFSNGYVAMPFLGVIIGALGTVLLPVFSRLEKGDGLSGDMLSVWNSAVRKSVKIIFPISIFCIFMARLVTVCFYGDVYDQSAIYYRIKNLYCLFYFIPFDLVLIAMGKTRLYSRVFMYFTLALALLEFLSVSFLDSPVYIAVISTAVSTAKCLVFLGLIAKFSSLRLRDIIPMKSLAVLSVASSVAAAAVLLITINLHWNKFVLLFFAVFAFCLIYYPLCRLFRISYKDIVEAAAGHGKLGAFITAIVP